MSIFYMNNVPMVIKKSYNRLHHLSADFILLRILTALDRGIAL